MKPLPLVILTAGLVIAAACDSGTRHVPTAPTFSISYTNGPITHVSVCLFGADAGFSYDQPATSTAAAQSGTFALVNNECEIETNHADFTGPTDVTVTENVPAGYVVDSITAENGNTHVITTVTGTNSITVRVSDDVSQVVRFYNHELHAGAIGDFVWNDQNQNGVQDAGEPGIPGQAVSISGPNGYTATTTTDANGFYEFTGLYKGDYSVSVGTPSGMQPTGSAQGGDPAKDSNGSPAAVTLPAFDAVDHTIDFGFFTPPPPPPPPCPGGSFTYSFNAAGDLQITYDQFPAPNDNSYGVNAVGWGSHGHTFNDLVGSDHAGFQLVDGTGVVRLSFNVDYLSANTAAPSGYASLGVSGGDGKMLVGTASGITATTSLANNLNNVNIPGLFNASHVQQFGSVNVLVNSPPTDAAHTTYNTSDPLLVGWDFHDTYFVTISAAKLASIGFDASTWKVEPNASQLHNSPAKACPTTGTGTCALVVTKTEVKDKQVKITITNNGTADVFLSDLVLNWPSAMNGKLMQVKLDGDVVYDNPDITGGSAHLALAQLVADQNKRKIQHGTSDVLTFIFEKNADHDLSHYSGTFTFGNCVVTIGP